MKITVEYEDDEMRFFAMAFHAPEAFSLLKEIYEKARSQLKYGEPDKDREVLEEIRTMSIEIIDRAE